MPQAALSVPTPDASQTAAASATPPAAQALAVPLAGVAIEIAGKALEGKNHFEIRLDPPELGRIEVRLDVDRDGNTTTHMIADRSDTLNLLRNDSSDLQRALQDAGLKTSDNGMQFSLRDQSMGQQQSNTPAPGAAQIVVNDNTLAAIDITPRSYARLAGMGGGIDIRV
jgi:flagellar hook-length control protein FliK